MLKDKHTEQLLVAMPMQRNEDGAARQTAGQNILHYILQCFFIKTSEEGNSSQVDK